MLPSETMIWQPEFTDKTFSRKPGAVHIVARRHGQHCAKIPKTSVLQREA
ncbi:PapI protein [Escherichia coli]|nr:PapI protein [Escherichia coli]